MESNEEFPFDFGHPAEGLLFINRVNERKRLAANVTSHINTILISPRRWGKTSLVHQVAEDLKAKNIKFCFVDAFNIRSEELFYYEMAKQLIKCTSTKVEEWMLTAKQFLSRITPRFTISMDKEADFHFDMNLKELKKSAGDILNLAERIAKAKNIRIVVCIDEFQNIEFFDDPLAFQKQLRSAWQHHKYVTYVLYGSKRSMLMQLFEKQSMPFYRFGDVMYIEKIAKDHWIAFLIARFQKTKKKISKELAARIADTVQCHPYYVQQLAHITWHNTHKEVTEAIYDKSVNDLLSGNLITFQKDFDSLSNVQVNLVHAVSKGNISNLTRAEVVNEFNLGSSANVIRMINALEKKEIVEKINKQIIFLDPVFELWLKKIFP